MEDEKDRAGVTVGEVDTMSAMEAVVSVDGVSTGDAIVDAEMVVEETANVAISSVTCGLLPTISTYRTLSSIASENSNLAVSFLERDEGILVEESPVKVANKIGQPLMIPEVGMVFESEEKAYEMYNTYAGQKGFSIKRGHSKHRQDQDHTLAQKYFNCSSEGFGKNKSAQNTTRTGCKARVQFSVSKDGIWTIQKVVLDHNHYLATPNKSHMLRSQRRVIEADRMLIGQIREAGMKPAQVYGFMKEFYGGADKVPFSKMDCNNEIGRERRKYLESNDAQTLLEYLKNKQLEDPTFLAVP